MYKITSVEIENNILASRVILTMDDATTLEVVVRVKEPKTKADVLAAILHRESLEKAKYNAAPTLTVIKAELDGKYVGVLSTEVKE